MARRTEGLGADSKVPLRGLIDLFKELDAPTKNTLRSAFTDAEDLQNFFSRSVPERQNRRRISGRIDTITLNAESTLLGGFLKWNRLNDKRIAFYEVQVSDTNVFASSETYTQVETFLALENLRSSKFARVRGVTAAGLTGLFSNVVRIRPKVSAPKVYSLDFYQRYGDGPDPILSKKLVYSGGNVFSSDSHPKFYSIFSDLFYLDRDIGGGLIWGNVSGRLKKFKDGGTVPWDRVRFKVNGITRSDTYAPHWSINYDESDFHQNERSSGSVMTFYGKGGYTSSFGPYAVSLPNSLAGEGPNDPHQVIRREIADATFYWTDPMSAVSASRFDEGQLIEFDSLLPGHEANSLGIGEGQKTEWLVFRDFKFNIPSDSTIVGIEAKIKRRQFSQFNNPINKDNGKVPAPSKVPVFTPSSGFLGAPAIGRFPVVEDATFNSPVGRFVFNEQSTAMLTSRTPTVATSSLNFGTNFSVTGWALTSELGLSTRHIVGFGNNRTGAFAPGRNGFFISRRSINPIFPPSTLWFRVPGLEANHTNFFTATNKWFHFACVATHNPVTRIVTLAIYRNGLLSASGTGIPSGSTLANPYNWTLTSQGTADLFEDQSTDNGLALLGGISNVGIFNRSLTAAEVFAIYNEGGRADLRQNFGDYRRSDDLVHYYLYLPDQADIRDESVYLVDNTDTIRTDLTNKAITNESWPALSQFFYTDLRQYGFLPIALSQGIPHDNHTAIGYQDYGNENDLWGRNWTPAEINSFYFGLALRAKNEPLNGYRGYAFVDHAKLTVYTVPTSSREVQIDVEVAAANEFYLEREVYGGICNIIEMGEKLSEA